MGSILVETIDGEIYNSDAFVSELILEATNNDKVYIDLNGEGPCCMSIGLESILDYVVNNHGVDSNVFNILTSNQLTSSKYKETRITFVELELAKKHIKKHESNQENIFGIFIGRSNWVRMGVASYLWKHAKSSTLMTYHCDFKNPYFRDNIGTDNLLVNDDGFIDRMDFLKELPIKLDDKISTYPILWNKDAFDVSNYYDDFFCEIICETYFTGKTFFITEKTFRCIANHKPFIVLGSKYYLKNLRRLGFKTFGDWWNEAYDINDGITFRYTSVLDVIKQIVDMPSETISQWKIDMEDITTHNANVLASLTNETILNTEFYYE